MKRQRRSCRRNLAQLVSDLLKPIIAVAAMLLLGQDEESGRKAIFPRAPQQFSQVVSYPPPARQLEQLPGTVFKEGKTASQQNRDAQILYHPDQASPSSREVKIDV